MRCVSWWAMGMVGWCWWMMVSCGANKSCPYVCEALQRRCITQGLLICTNNVTSGCYDWSLVPCHPGETCQQQGLTFACVGNPTQNCEPKQMRKDCVGSQIFWFDACGQRGELVLACDANSQCKDGQCVAGQSQGNCGAGNQICARGERRCVGKLVQDCIWDAQKACGTWGNPNDCGSGRTCRDGYCKADDSGCPNACAVGTKRCVGVALQSCEAGTQAGCGQWGAIQSCPQNQMCVDGICYSIPANCPNSCALGAKRCGPNQSVELCKSTGGQCPAWQVDRQCPTDQVCQGGQCIEPCPQACSDGQQRCVGAEIQECRREGNCTSWVLAYRCGSLQTCRESGGRYFCECPAGTLLAPDGSTCTQDPNIGTCGMNAEEKQVFQLVNQERIKQGLSVFFCHTNLVSVARSWSQTQCNRGQIGHDGFVNRLQSSSLHYTAGGENVAAGQDSPESVLQAWMSSDGHRNNILNPVFTYMGVGYFNCGQGYQHYWTQIFVRLR